MSERTDERTSGGDGVDDLLDDSSVDHGGGTADGEVGLSDDELGVDVDALTGDPAGGASGADTSGASAEASSDSGEGLLSRLTPSVGRPSGPDVPSARSFVFAFVAVIGGLLAGSAVPLIGSITGVLGIVAGAFALGLASGKRRYFPVAVAGAAAAVLSVMTGSFTRIALISDMGLTSFAAIGATTGILAAVLGHYLGRDLRTGLTRDV